MAERVEVSVVIAFRVAKVLDASIYDVIAGRAVPADTCKHCGKGPSEHWRCEGEAGANLLPRRKDNENRSFPPSGR